MAGAHPRRHAARRSVKERYGEMDIGKPETEREIQVEPITEPVPREAPVPREDPVEEPAREPVPA
jgi:hypothetical protein